MLIRDLVIANAVALTLALFMFWIGWTPINAISISFLIVCAILFIIGGALGFFLSSISFDSITQLFRPSKKKEEESEVEKKRPRIKTKEDERKEQVNVGKRLIIAGSVLLGELLLISVIYILVY